MIVHHHDHDDNKDKNDGETVTVIVWLVVTMIPTAKGCQSVLPKGIIIEY